MAPELVETAVARLACGPRVPMGRSQTKSVHPSFQGTSHAEECKHIIQCLVASLVGFSDAAAFSHAFKRRAGRFPTPRERGAQIARGAKAPSPGIHRVGPRGTQPAIGLGTHRHALQPGNRSGSPSDVGKMDWYFPYVEEKMVRPRLFLPISQGALRSMFRGHRAG